MTLMTNHKSNDQIKQLGLQPTNLFILRLHLGKNVYTFLLVRVKYYATEIV